MPKPLRAAETTQYLYLRNDLEMLRSGEWIPDDDSIDASLELLAQAEAAHAVTVQLARDLFGFIENVTDETPNKTELFFALRERVESYLEQRRTGDGARNYGCVREDRHERTARRRPSARGGIADCRRVAGSDGRRRWRRRRVGRYIHPGRLQRERSDGQLAYDACRRRSLHHQDDLFSHLPGHGGGGWCPKDRRRSNGYSDD